MELSESERIAELEAENQRLRRVTDDLHAACEQKQEIIDSDKCLAGELLALRIAAQAVVDEDDAGRLVPYSEGLSGAIDALSKTLLPQQEESNDE